MAPDARTDLPPRAESAGEARAFVRDVLAAWDCDDHDQLAALLTTEVVTNAVLHAATQVSLSVRVDDLRQVVRIEVGDGDATLPLVTRHLLDSDRGRGMLLVERLARDWGAEVVDGGKVVWFELAARRRR